MNILVKLALKVRNTLNKLDNTNHVHFIEIGTSIPKVIHQTYFKKELPIEIQQNIQNLKNTNPDWIFKLYDDDDIVSYIKTHFPELLNFYLKINDRYGAARADFFRYLVIYNEGGLYLDIKSSISKPLKDVIFDEDKYLLCHWENAPGQRHEVFGHHGGIKNPHGEFQQWHVVAAKGHPFLKAVIENVCNNILHYNPYFHDVGGWAVINCTGPLAYTLAITPLLNTYPHRLERDNTSYGLIYSIYEDQNLAVGHHNKIMKRHYTILSESLIKLNPLNKLLFNIVKPCLIFLTQHLKKLSKH
jgi:inositol phosphorylceramide mannosyltransferase catalytic subunit